MSTITTITVIKNNSLFALQSLSSADFKSENEMLNKAQEIYVKAIKKYIQEDISEEDIECSIDNGYCEDLNDNSNTVYITESINIFEN